MLGGLLSGSAWFTLFLLGHVLAFHFLRIRDRFKLIARTFATCVLGHLASVGVLHACADWLGDAYRGPAVSFCAGLMAMLCLFVLYMPFYFTIATSLSVQSLILIERSPGRAMPVEVLAEQFASRPLLEQRLETMARNGYLVQHGDGFRPTAKGRLAGRCFQALKRLWRLGAGG